MTMTTLSRMRQRITTGLNRLRLPAVAREVKRRRLTYLSDAKLLSLRDAIREITRKGVQGDFVEYGVALGGSAVYLASETRERRRFRGYDVFGMIPAPGERDDDRSRLRYNEYGGCKRAVDEFLVASPRFELVRTRPHAVVYRG